MGVGMPQALLLQEFGSQVWSAFGEPPYHVGSSLANKTGWRDVDVRLILDDLDLTRLFPDINPGHNDHLNPKWVAWCIAFSALGKQMTGLPIDFQIQQCTHANTAYPNQPRSALGMVGLRTRL